MSAIGKTKKKKKKSVLKLIVNETKKEMTKFINKNDDCQWPLGQVAFRPGVQLLAQWLAPLVLTTWAGVRIPPTAFWGGDLMEGNPRDPSHLRVQELWVRVVVRPIIAQMCPTPC
jgi:hypothetical protein